MLWFVPDALYTLYIVYNIYILACTYATCDYIYIYIYIEREREREREIVCTRQSDYKLNKSACSMFLFCFWRQKQTKFSDDVNESL